MAQTINYNFYTILPTRIVQKAETMGAVLEVITPHKGAVFLELNRIDRGIFRPASEVSENTNSIIEKLQELEREASRYLFNRWLLNANLK